MNKKKATEHIQKYIVTYLFIALSVLFIVVSGLDINYVASQLLLRLNGIILYALTQSGGGRRE